MNIINGEKPKGDINGLMFGDDLWLVIIPYKRLFRQF